MNKHIGLIFGSFNPIHNGHIEIAKAAINNGFVDEVFFVPAIQNPFKEQYSVSFEDRCNMCKLACAELNDNRFGVLEIEKYVNEIYGNTKTYNVLSYLNNSLANDNSPIDFVIICGDDMYDQIPVWYNGSEILNNNKFIIVSRNTNVTITNNVIAIISENNYEDISSTLVRDAIRNNSDIFNNLQFVVPNAVLNEIICKNFYK